MRQLLIFMVIALVLLVACGSEVTQNESPTKVLIGTPATETPKDTYTLPPTSTQEKPPKINPTLEPETSSFIEINQPYLMAFHACDSFNIDCHDPRNHQVYLAGADDVETWSLIPGWAPFQGSVPDVIRRGDTLYVYTGPWLVRYYFDTGLLDQPVQVEISPGEGMDPNENVLPTDVSLIRDDQDRLVMFFLFGKMGSDPAMCGPGEASCTKNIGSAIEVEGSNGGSFIVQPGERISAEIGEGKGFMSLSDPDIFTDGQDFYLLLSHGSWTSVWSSMELHGDYQKIDVTPMGFLTTGSGGVASGYYHPEEERYWIFSNAHLDEGMVIRFAATKDLSRELDDRAWTTILSGEILGLGPGFNVESPGFTVNEP
jgi:hypothetical protein